MCRQFKFNVTSVTQPQPHERNAAQEKKRRKELSDEEREREDDDNDEGKERGGEEEYSSAKKKSTRLRMHNNLINVSINLPGTGKRTETRH